MLDINPMFAPGLDQNHTIGDFYHPLYGGLEPIDMTRKNQNSGASSSPSLDFASFNSCQYKDEINSNGLVFRGSASNDLLYGTSGNDKLFGLSGDDILNGGDGDDLLKGGAGNDHLVGSFGNDLLLDSHGGDVMTGGKGADLFWLGSWNQPNTPSIITDFEVGTDTIKIGRLGATFEQLCIQDIAEATLISDQGNILAILPGVDADSLSADSLLFGNPELANQFQTALDESIKGTATPGVTKAIITPDGFTWQGASGVSEVIQQTPMQPDDILGIASVTKTFVAATVLKLVEEGTLSLDDTLGKWVPEIAQNIPDSQSVTLRQLLNGSGGIPNRYAEQNVSNFINTYSDFLKDSIRDERPEETVASVYGQPRFSGQGSSPIWTYPEIASDLAGLVVEKATGSSFSSVMREQVLEPLGLERTFFVGDEQISGNVAHGYEDIFTADGSLGRDGVLEDYTDVHLSTASDGWASGAMYSTAQDVAQFSSALFSGELLNPESLNEMLMFVDNGIPVPFEGNGYGLGVASFENPSGREWGKNGDNIAYTAEMRYSPDQGGATTVTLKNTSNFDPAVLANPEAAAAPITNPQITPATSVS